MPTPEDQFHPSQEFLSAFISDMLSPKLNQLAAEGLAPYPVRIITVSRHDEITAESPDNPGSICKVAFYKTHSTERLVLKCSVRLTQKHEASGLSGFDLTGQIKSGAAQVRGFTLVYNKIGFSRI